MLSKFIENQINKFKGKKEYETYNSEFPSRLEIFRNSDRAKTTNAMLDRLYNSPARISSHTRIHVISLAHGGVTCMVRKLNIFQFETAPRGFTLLVQHRAKIPFELKFP